MMEVYEEKVTAGAPGAIDHIALDVTDIDKVFDEVQALGYKSLEGRSKSFLSGRRACVSLQYRDPTVRR